MIGRLWRGHPVLTAVFALALMAALFFGARALTFAVTFAWRSAQPVAGWMTPGYILRSYDIPREVIAGILKIDDRTEARLPLDVLARRLGRPLPEVLADLEAAIARYEAQGALE